MADQNRPCKLCGVSKAPEEYYPCGEKYRQRTCKQCKKKPSKGPRALGKIDDDKFNRIQAMLVEAKLYKDSKGAAGVKRSTRSIAELEGIPSATLAYWVREGKFKVDVDVEASDNASDSASDDTEVEEKTDVPIPEPVPEVKAPTPKRKKVVKAVVEPAVAVAVVEEQEITITFKGTPDAIRAFVRATWP